MEIKLHANATTTPRVRRYIQESPKSDRELAQELGISVSTVRRWRNRTDAVDRTTTPKSIHKVLRQEQSAVINWLRQTFIVPLDELVTVVTCGMQQPVSRAGLDRYLRRAEIAHMNVLGARVMRGKKAIRSGVFPGHLRIFYRRISLLPQDGGEFHVLWAEEAVSGWLAARAYAGASAQLVAHWLDDVFAAAPGDIQSVETENKKLFGLGAVEDHPLQAWCAEKEVTLTVSAADATDITLHLECRLAELIPAIGELSLDAYLQQVCERYNRQWPQKKLGDLTPVQFWQQYADR